MGAAVGTSGVRAVDFPKSTKPIEMLLRNLVVGLSLGIVLRRFQPAPLPEPLPPSPLEEAQEGC